MGPPLRGVLLDTHVLHWLSAEPERLSQPARAAISDASEISVAAITWFELAWLAHAERIVVNVPIRAWLDGLAASVRTRPITPAVAERAATLPSTFPGEPADRLIYATASEAGLPLVSKDARMRDHVSSIALW